MAQAVAWHRQVAAMVEAADRAGVATEELPGLRQRIAAQAGRLTQAATQTGGPLPALVPTPAEIAVAAQAFGDLSPEAVARAVRTIDTTLAAADAAIEGRADPLAGAAAGGPGAAPVIPAQPAAGSADPGASATASPPAEAAAAGTTTARPRVGLRNAAVYGAYAVPVLGVQAFLFLLLDEVSSLPLAAPLCLLVLPALAFLAGYLTIGTLFPAPPGEKVNRTPRLGVVVCLIPNALLCAGFVALFVRNIVGG
jgi:hypothetical protein